MGNIPIPIPVWFGTNENLVCIQGVERFNLKAADGDHYVCYAAKTKTESFILPYRISLAGYVFADDDGMQYFNPEPKDIAYLQSIGDLPSHLPVYTLSIYEIVAGNLLWPLLVLPLAWKMAAHFGILFGTTKTGPRSNVTSDNKARNKDQSTIE